MLLSRYNYENERTLNSERIILTKNIDRLSQDIQSVDNKIFQLSKELEKYDNQSNKDFSNQDYYLRYKIFQIKETFNINKINIECFTVNKYINTYFPIYKRFQDAFNKSSTKEIRIVFHGTNKCNIDEILRGGLDPSRRTRQAYGPGEYFGKDIKTSLGYCQGGNMVLVFAILYNKDGITIENDTPQHNPGEKMLVINKIEYQLPIGYVTL